MNQTGGDDANASIGLDDAYGLETPADNLRLYKAWATTYDTDFRAFHGYIYPDELVAAFAELAGPGDGPAIDIGCGTGAVGEQLRQRGPWLLDGLDLSPEMLAVAADKAASDGNPVYRNLFEVDLLAPNRGAGLIPGSYAAAVSTGLFTHGHVGPEAIETVATLVRPGGLLCFGVNEHFFAAAGFGSTLDRLCRDGRIEPAEVSEIPIYAAGADHEHAGDKASLVTTRVR